MSEEIAIFATKRLLQLRLLIEGYFLNKGIKYNVESYNGHFNGHYDKNRWLSPGNIFFTENGNFVLSSRGHIARLQSYSPHSTIRYIMEDVGLQALLSKNSDIVAYEIDTSKYIIDKVIDICNGAQLPQNEKENTENKYYEKQKENESYLNLLKKAESGDAEAMLKLAYEIFGKDSSNTKDAFYWTEKAANLGNAQAQFELAEIYKKGMDNDLESFKWLEKSARNGYTKAKHNLAIYYSTGTGTWQDNRQAFYWMELASNEGHAGAKRKLGCFYIEGTGTPIDKDKGLSLLREAASMGDEQAKKLLSDLDEDSKTKKVHIIIMMVGALIGSIIGGIIGVYLGSASDESMGSLIGSFFGLGLGHFIREVKGFIMFAPYGIKRVISDEIKKEGFFEGLVAGFFKGLIGCIFYGIFKLIWELFKGPFIAIYKLVKTA